MVASRSFYREVAPPPPLRRDLLCSWVGVVGAEGPPAVDRVLPDGCTDVVWDGARLFVAGPDETAAPLRRQAGSTTIGVRLRPGRAPALGTSAAELTGRRIELAELWGREAHEIAERLERTTSPDAARRLLERHVASRLREEGPADVSIASLVRLFGSNPQLGVSRVARELGLSRRQLQRRSLVALGYGPKTFASIMRFQQFIRRGRDDADAQLAELAQAAGYSDQAHLSRECRRLSGLTPRDLLLWQRNVPFVQDTEDVGALRSNR